MTPHRLFRATGGAAGSSGGAPGDLPIRAQRGLRAAQLRIRGQEPHRILIRRRQKELHRKRNTASGHRPGAWSQ